MDTQKATIPLQIVILISPVMYFQVQSSVQSRCVQYPPNDPLPILKEKVGGQGWEGGKSRHLTKVVNHCVTSDEAGETRGEGRALRARASAHQAEEPQTTPSGSRQRESPFCRVKLIRNALED